MNSLWPKIWILFLRPQMQPDLMNISSAFSQINVSWVNGAPHLCSQLQELGTSRKLFQSTSHESFVVSFSKYQPSYNPHPTVVLHLRRETLTSIYQCTWQGESLCGYPWVQGVNGCSHIPSCLSQHHSGIFPSLNFIVTLGSLSSIRKHNSSYSSFLTVSSPVL